MVLPDSCIWHVLLGHEGRKDSPATREVMAAPRPTPTTMRPMTAKGPACTGGKHTGRVKSGLSRNVARWAQQCWAPSAGAAPVYKVWSYAYTPHA